MRVVPVRPSSNSRFYCYVVKLQLVGAKQRNRAYETPENIRSDLATDQIKAFRENPCRGIARLAATATKHDLYIALVVTVRDHPELRRFECAHVTYFLRRSFCPDSSGE